MADIPPWLAIWFLLLAMNGSAFAAFGIDKQRAIHGEWRISEQNLLLLAFIGGTGGAYLGRWYFRHKTRKQGFSAALHLIALIQIGLLGWMVTRHSLLPA